METIGFPHLPSSVANTCHTLHVICLHSCATYSVHIAN